MKRFDYPPLWLLLFLVATIWDGHVFGAEPDPFIRYVGWGLILAAIVMTVLALRTLSQHETTFIPHQQPSRLVTSGPFRISRHPIYLSDVVILIGASLLCGAWLGLVSVPLFVLVLTRRFIGPEDAKLQAAFGEDFEAWSATTPRWIWRF